MFAATAAAKVLRHRGAGSNYSSRSHRRQHGPSIFEKTPRSGASGLCASVAGALSETHFGRAFVSGTTVEDGNDLRRFFRRGSGRAAARVWFQTFGGAHEGDRSEAASWNGAQWDFTQSAG